MNVRRETLICDTSFVSHLWRMEEAPDRYDQWSGGDLARLATASLAISVVTLAELRAGYVRAGWGRRRIADAERKIASYFPLLIDNPHLDEWARLSVTTRARGVALSDNDLWVAATASVKAQPLVTCDRDHQRIASELPVEVVFLAPPV